MTLHKVEWGYRLKSTALSDLGRRLNIVLQLREILKNSKNISISINIISIKMKIFHIKINSETAMNNKVLAEFQILLWHTKASPRTPIPDPLVYNELRKSLSNLKPAQKFLHPFLSHHISPNTKRFCLCSLYYLDLSLTNYFHYANCAKTLSIQFFSKTLFCEPICNAISGISLEYRQFYPLVKLSAIILPQKA